MIRASEELSYEDLDPKGLSAALDLYTHRNLKTPCELSNFTV